ncbi:MAG: hypothetical protein ACFFFC_00810 [Candidatus Thorarchaeota archaeon]
MLKDDNELHANDAVKITLCVNAPDGSAKLHKVYSMNPSTFECTRNFGATTKFGKIQNRFDILNICGDVIKVEEPYELPPVEDEVKIARPISISILKLAHFLTIELHDGKALVNTMNVTGQELFDVANNDIKTDFPNRLNKFSSRAANEIEDPKITQGLIRAIVLDKICEYVKSMNENSSEIDECAMSAEHQNERQIRRLELIDNITTRKSTADDFVILCSSSADADFVDFGEALIFGRQLVRDKKINQIKIKVVGTVTWSDSIDFDPAQDKSLHIQGNEISQAIINMSAPAQINCNSDNSGAGIPVYCDGIYFDWSAAPEVPSDFHVFRNIGKGSKITNCSFLGIVTDIIVGS